MKSISTIKSVFSAIAPPLRKFKISSMSTEIQKLHNVWSLPHIKGTENTELPKISFDDLTNSITNVGPFYYYIIDFYDMSLSHVSSSIEDIHGMNPETVTFTDILESIHPDDLEFIAQAEAACVNLIYKKIGQEKATKYKSSYNFRCRLANGQYALFNHQALMLTMDSTGKYGKSLNIHTRVDHISSSNTYQYSLIGLRGEPSYMNINAENTDQKIVKFSKREMDVIRGIADGLSNSEIAEKYFISILTVKKHRNNILNKSDCKTSAQLISTCVRHGLI